MRKNKSNFDIQTLQKQVDELRRRAEEVPERLEEILPGVFEELMNTLEDLKVAEADLKTSEQLQNEIIERRRAEDEVRESEKRFRQLFDEAPVGYHELDTEGCITRVNRTELNMLGYSAEEMLGQPIWNFIVEKEVSQKSFVAKIARITPPGRAFERTFRRKDGTTLPVIAEDRHLQDENGKIIGLRSTIQDITEQNKLKEQLARSEKLSAIGQLSAAIAHEIRNPLGAIYNSIDVLRDSLDLSENQKKLMDVVIEAMEKLGKIVDDFLSFARPRELTLEEVNIKDIINDTVLLLKQDDRFRSDIVMDIHYEREVPTAKIDVTLFPEVFLNILINSIQSMTEGGEIAIDVGKSYINGKEVLGIKISDTGEGIPPDILNKIFEPFYTTREDGTGLGLAVVNRIISDHGGTIDVESRVGDGTTFTLKLPLLNK